MSARFRGNHPAEASVAGGMLGRRVVALACGASLAMGGCGLDHWSQADERSPTTSSPPSNVTDGYDQYGGVCPARSPLYGAMRAPGEACATATDCAPSCCPCTTSPRSWLASSCIAGRCAAPSDACQRTAYTAPWCAVGVPRPPAGTCGGNAFASPTCDGCFHMKCCADGDACPASGSCGALGRCQSKCADQACMDACAAAYPGSGYALDRLYRCLEVQCSAECSS